MAFLGGLFNTGGPKAKSVLSPEQEALLGPLAEQAQGFINPGNFEAQQMLQRLLLHATTGQAKRQAKTIFEQALLEPSLRVYDRDIAPRIGASFAHYGGTLSSRYGQTLAEGRTDVLKNAQSSLAGILPQIESFPLQQTLSQIQGLGALQQQRLSPFQAALQYALQPTRSIAQQPAGPGWDILNTGTGLLGLGLGAGLLGGSNPPQHQTGFPVT